MKRVTQNIWAETEIRGCNPGYVATSDGVVVIDSPQLPSKAAAMREEVSKRGAIRFLINTENHYDHIFGNHFFAGLCPVIGQEYILENFWAPVRGLEPYSFCLETVKQDDPQGMALMPAKEEVRIYPPAITFRKRLTVRVGEQVLELFHTPGHTKAQTCVYIPKERAAFVGDTIFCECQTWLQACDPDAWLRSLEFLKTLDIDYIIPGHGPVCNKDYIPKQSAFVREWVAAVASGIAKGWSKEECVKRINFLDRFPMDIGLASIGPMVQQLNVERLFDFLQGKTEKFE
jgi:cyclase